uniref:Uncharacterized protein n=1 Tax=Steinernema glaseri TaxID=37863 RepID=A0A1I8AJT8_9BILA
MNGLQCCMPVRPNRGVEVPLTRAPPAPITATSPAPSTPAPCSLGRFITEGTIVPEIVAGNRAFIPYSVHKERRWL